MLRFLTAGESHGQSLSVIVEGLPSGLAINHESLVRELARRRLGYGRGPRMRFERDELRLSAGIRHGRTLGSPVGIEVLNSEWPRWQEEMSSSPGVPSTKLTKPRPGHADLAGMQKYAFDDARDVLERASARETAARVAAGYFAKELLGCIGVQIISHVVQIGSATSPRHVRPLASDLDAIDESEVRCFEPDGERAMIAQIKAAAKDGDSLGGVVEVIAYGVPVGLGSHVHWDRKLDGLLAGALMSIQAVKAVEIGDGMSQASLRGSVAHDAIVRDVSYKLGGGFIRQSDHAGGLEGGISSGAPIIAKLAMKPLATLNRPVLQTVDLATGEATVSFKERTDVTAVPALGVVGEAMMALVLAQEALRKFGGDSVEEFVRNFTSYLANVGSTASAARPE
ncbi:MAG: chorismate synthase [Acidimicrobiales bacterium]